MVDKHGTSHMQIDSDVFQSVEVSSCPVQSQNVNVNE